MSLADPPKKDVVVITNAIADMAKVVEFVDRFGATHSVPGEVSNAFNLCLDELLNNVISYAVFCLKKKTTDSRGKTMAPACTQAPPPAAPPASFGPSRTARSP